jgi:Icc protein
LLAGAAGGLLLGPTLAHAAAPRAAKALRVAHLTDIHVQPERGAAKGMEACFAHALGQAEKPGLVITGGDLIMDAFAADEARTKTQWDIARRVLRDHDDVPVRHTVGNHDVFGWGNPGAHASNPKYGKAWACEFMEIERPYYSFDMAGWHFVVLDSTFFKEPASYTARLDDEQFEWLQGDLAAVPATKPVLVVSHIPILMVCSIFDGENEKSGDWVIPGSWMHIDARRIKALFAKHPNVKLCISGHEHLVDHVRLEGVTYCCNGAVSGGWWGGDYHGVTYGYGLIDLYEDGTFENQYVTYGWKTQP